jgi:hypothetical protein
MSRTDFTDTSFCLIGEPGTGKTHFLGTLPKPLYIFDFDKGLRTLAGIKGITYDTYRDGPHGQDKKTGDDLYGWGHAWQAFMSKLLEFSQSCPYASVAIDTVSFQMEACKNFARLRNPAKQGPTHMEQPQWGDVGNYMKNALDLFTMLKCIKVATCHLKRDVNPLNNDTEFVPLLEGQMQGKMPAFFDEVYYTNIKKEGVGAGATYRYLLQTAQSGLYKSARTRIGVPDGTDSNWQSVVNAVEQADAKRTAIHAAGSGASPDVRTAVRPANKYAKKS